MCIKMAKSAASAAARTVLDAVKTASRNAGRLSSPRVVAVSKCHPADKVLEAYEQGVRDFGENYVQELFSKSSLLAKSGAAADIRWHYIGNLQRRKAKRLISVPNLWMAQTLDREETAKALDTACSLSSHMERPLKVLVQVNTSREPNKHGCLEEMCVDLSSFVHDMCPHLQFCGLMAVGRVWNNASLGPNPDFLSLVRCGGMVKESLQLEQIELSMGMSSSYLHAIELGSTIVRVGEAIFGPRPLMHPPSATAGNKEMINVKGVA